MPARDARNDGKGRQSQSPVAEHQNYHRNYQPEDGQSRRDHCKLQQARGRVHVARKP